MTPSLFLMIMSILLFNINLAAGQHQQLKSTYHSSVLSNFIIFYSKEYDIIHIYLIRRHDQLSYINQVNYT